MYTIYTVYNLYNCINIYLSISAAKFIRTPFKMSITDQRD